MLNKLIPLTWGQARYEFLKELDTPGEIGERLIVIQPMIAELAFRASNWVDTFKDWIPDPKTQECPDDLPFLDPDVQQIIYSTASYMPYLILAHSEWNWTLFFSAFVTFVGTGIETTIRIIEAFCTDPNDALFLERKQSLRDIDDYLKPLHVMAEFDVSYQDLIRAGALLMDEIKGWQQCNPSAIRLSSAYLQAIGFDK